MGGMPQGWILGPVLFVLLSVLPLVEIICRNNVNIHQLSYLLVTVIYQTKCLFVSNKTQTVLPVSKSCVLSIHSNFLLCHNYHSHWRLSNNNI